MMSQAQQWFSEYRLLFRFSTQNYNVDAEYCELMEDAFKFLAARYFKYQQFNECIDEFDGFDFPFATHFCSEAFKKLDVEKRRARQNC